MTLYARNPGGKLFKATAEDASYADITSLRQQMGGLFFKEFRQQPGAIMVVIK